MVNLRIVGSAKPVVIRGQASAISNLAAKVHTDIPQEAIWFCQFWHGDSTVRKVDGGKGGVRRLRLRLRA
jgi:hypothetical protein